MEEGGIQIKNFPFLNWEGNFISYNPSDENQEVK